MMSGKRKSAGRHVAMDDGTNGEAIGVWEGENGAETKRHKPGPASASKGKSGSLEEGGFGPHVIKMGHYDEAMMERVCQKYKKMGYSVQMKGNIIKLNVINAQTCLQEEVREMCSDQSRTLEYADMMVVSSNGQEIPCHRFILSARSPVFKKLISAPRAEGEDPNTPLRIMTEACTATTQAMIKYLYTDSLETQEITEDLMSVAEKYQLGQLKEQCLPSFVKKVDSENCLKMYIYGHAHNYEPLKTQAFNVLDANWNHFESTNLLIDMMKTNPQAVLEILNRLHKKKSGFVIQAPQMNLKMLKAFHTFQEDIIKAFAEGMEHTDMTLVSSTGQEIPCHRFILSTRSAEFGKMFGLLGTGSTEALRIPLDATTTAIRTLVQYLYTDSVGVDDVTEELIALSEKYKLQQLREFCMPTFIEKINTANCLKMYAYGYKHQFEEVKGAAFKTLDDNWKNYATSSDFLDMMQACPNGVLEIMSKFHKFTESQPIVLDKGGPMLVDF